MKVFVITIIASMFAASNVSFAHGGIIVRTGKAQVEKIELVCRAEMP